MATRKEGPSDYGAARLSPFSKGWRPSANVPAAYIGSTGERAYTISFGGPQRGRRGGTVMQPQ